MDRTVPTIRMWPKIIEFLGYDPLGKSRFISGQQLAYRRIMGLSQEMFARKLRVDEGTVAHWEHGTRQPTKANWEAICMLIYGRGKAALQQIMTK